MSPHYVTGDMPGSGEHTAGRCSGRVESPEVKHAGTQGLSAISAPETFTRFTQLVGGAVAGSAAGAERNPNARRSGRISRQQLMAIQAELSQRDRSILRSVSQHRFLTTHHLQALHFSSHATHGAASRICRRVLARLHGLRVIEHLDRRIGGVRAGSASYVWRVGLIGDQLLRLESGSGVRARRKEPSERWLDHCLAVADVHLTLIEASREQSIELLDIQTEPTCWRDYVAASGSRVTLKPDLSVTIGSGDFEDHWFIEVDRATESLPTLMGKCRQYQVYRRSGQEQQQRQVFPVVLWVVPDNIRATKLQAALQAARGIDTNLFRVTPTNQVLEEVVRGAA